MTAPNATIGMILASPPAVEVIETGSTFGAVYSARFVEGFWTLPGFGLAQKNATAAARGALLLAEFKKKHDEAVWLRFNYEESALAVPEDVLLWSKVKIRRVTYEVDPAGLGVRFGLEFDAVDNPVWVYLAAAAVLVVATVLIVDDVADAVEGVADAEATVKLEGVEDITEGLRLLTSPDQGSPLGKFGESLALLSLALLLVSGAFLLRQR